MHSNGWSKKQIIRPSQTNIHSSRPIQRAKATAAWPSSPVHPSWPHPPCSPSQLLPLKTQILLKRLSFARRSQPLLESSSITNLKSTKCPQLIRIETSSLNDNNSHLHSMKQQLQQSNPNQLESLQEEYQFLDEKFKEMIEVDRNNEQQLRNEVETLSRIIKEINAQSQSYLPLRKEFRIYSTIISSNYARKEPQLYTKPSRIQTKNSVCKQPSLLLSFKKNVQEEDGYITLKYSEESAIKESHDTLLDNWQQLPRLNKSKNNHNNSIHNKNSLKGTGDVREGEIRENNDVFYEGVRQEIMEYFGGIKQDVNTCMKESQEIVGKFEEVLEEIVQDIAEEKVQREHTWKDIENNNNDLVREISQMLSYLHSDTLSFQSSSQQSLRNLRSSYLSSLKSQQTHRRQQQRLLLKMLMQAVDFIK